MKIKSLFLPLFCIALFANTVMASVEICGNGIDDDLDGMTDCADPDCSSFVDCELTFSCSSDLYQVISGVLKIFDPVSSSYTVVGSSGIGSYNGAGYNVEDGYIYGIASGNHLIRINNTGAATDLGEVANWSAATYRADVDTSGNWISYNSGANPTLTVIDIDATPLTMQLSALTNLHSGNIPGVADITFNPKTAKFYGMANGLQLVEIDPPNLTIDVVADFDGSSGGFGAAWSDRDGNSYFSNNSTGEIYAVKFDSTSAPYDLKIVAYGEVTSNNDGINCILSNPPVETDCGDGIDNDGDGVVDNEDADCKEIPEFTKVKGIGSGNNWGITFVDYNNDQFDDIFIPSYDETPSTLYVNNGNGTFSGIGINDVASSLAASWGDYDNDGYLDLVVANNVGKDNFLYKNNSGVLSRVDNANLMVGEGYSHSISYVDYDNDSYLDIFVSDYFDSEFNQLYRNTGSGSFERVNSGILANDAVSAIGTTWADVNNDGWMDAFVPVHNGSNLLYTNQKDGTFSRQEMGDNSTSVGSSFGDYDNDGDLDLFVANASREDNFLYRNDGGVFTLVSNSIVSNDGGDSHGSTWGDFDNDGWLDLFVTNDQNGAKFLYLNDGDGTFTKITTSPIIIPDGNSFGVASADYNNDGNLDVAIANHSGDENFLYQNNSSNGNNYINLVLQGTNSNASALGTKIFLTATIDGQSITQLHEVSGQTGGGAGSQNSLVQHFGLGDAATIDLIRIEWPSGYEQILTNVTPNQKMTIVEENGSLVTGTIYNDANANCIQDNGEIGIANTIVEINGGTAHALTDENGFYRVYLKPGSYTVDQQIGSNFTNSCQASAYNVNVSGIGQVFPDNDFANQAIVQAPDLKVDLGVTALRRGFENDLVISYSNQGVVNANNTILSLTLDTHISAVGSDKAWDNVSGLTYEWNLGTLSVNESNSINLSNYVDLAAELETTKTFSVTIRSDEDDLNTANNTAQTSEKIVGSFDPNDILVSPIGFGPAHLIQAEDTLTYRIRFQNVGNYYASFVTVLDTLSEDLDMNTLTVGAASHEYEFEILEGRILKWFFNDINLPDSTLNEPESHGFVQFKIAPKADLSDKTRITNSASIKFDFNIPIITNTVYNTIDLDYDEAAVEEDRLFLYPNPANEYVKLFVHRPSPANNKRLGQDTWFEPESIDLNAKIRLYSMNGLFLQELEMDAQTLQVDISGLSRGMYLVSCVQDNGGVFVGKLVKH